MRFPDQSESQVSKRTQIAIELKMERMFLLPVGFAGCSLPSPPELVGKDVFFCVCSVLVFQLSRVYLSVHCAFCSQAVPHATSSYNSSLPLLTTDIFVSFCYFYICIIFKHIKTFFCISLICFCDY